MRAAIPDHVTPDWTYASFVVVRLNGEPYEEIVSEIMQGEWADIYTDSSNIVRVYGDFSLAWAPDDDPVWKRSWPDRTEDAGRGVT